MRFFTYIVFQALFQGGLKSTSMAKDKILIKEGFYEKKKEVTNLAVN